MPENLPDIQKIPFVSRDSANQLFCFFLSLSELELNTKIYYKNRF